MKKKYYLCFLILTCSICSAQNLAPNPSFESYYNCPTASGQVYQCQNWTTFGRSPDYFNACSTDSNVSVPGNYLGSEYAATGSAYCGLVSYSAPYIAEQYIGAQLVQPLVSGQKYFASVEISRADNSSCATNKIGILFSTVPFDSLNPPPMNDFAHVYTDSIVSLSSGWYPVKGSFIADSNYAYIIIGNFFMNTSYACPILTFATHYYIDDVCVSTDSLTCNSTVGINNINNENEVSVFPNPFDDKININVISKNVLEITLFDMTGRKILMKTFSGSNSICTEKLTKGFYLYEIRNEDGVVMKGKLERR